MGKSVGDVVDIVAFIILLAAGISLGIFGIFNVYRENLRYTLSTEDKNSIYKMSDSTQYGEYTPLLTAGDMIIMAQLQDVGMPNTNVVVVNGRAITIDTDRTDNYASYSALMKGCVNKKFSYDIVYSYVYRYFTCSPYVNCHACDAIYSAYLNRCPTCSANNNNVATYGH